MRKLSAEGFKNKPLSVGSRCLLGEHGSTGIVLIEAKTEHRIFTDADYMYNSVVLLDVVSY